MEFSGNSMNAVTLLAYASALFGGALAAMVVWNERRSVVNLAFVVGFLVLAAESIFTALSLRDGGTLLGVVHWQQWRLLVTSFLPGIWLWFSLTYGRGNYREFVQRWRYALFFFFIVPPLLALFGDLFNQRAIEPASGHFRLGLGMAGYVLNLLLLLSMVLVLMNLERTFRASVGTMRWRIKFMVLGLGVLFAVRAYTTSETLIFRAYDVPLEAVDCGALFVACILLLRSLSREGHFAMDIYPSHSVLQSSFTVIIAGVYLLVIGVLTKIVTKFSVGGDSSFTVKAFLVLVAL